MPGKKARISSKPVLGIIGTIVLGTIGSLLASLILKISIADVFHRIGLVIYKVLVSAIPVWILLIMAVPSAIAVIFFHKKRHKNRSQLPDWYSFRKMEFRGRLFSWEYPYQSSEPINIKEMCKQCGCELNETRCPNCDYAQTPLICNSRDYYHFISDLIKVIKLKRDNNEYKKYIRH